MVVCDGPPREYSEHLPALLDLVRVGGTLTCHGLLAGGRIADRTPAENIHSGNGDNLERIDWLTYDMRQLAARDAKILSLEQEICELRRKLPPE